MKRTKVLKNFDKKEQVRRKQEKGITLIALVITIIVLLILAAVSIATLTGENGILSKANTAKEETEKASKEEQRQLAIIEANMNDKETEFQGVKIPAECAPTRIEGESTVAEGLVIVDSEGNSYVWIEVPKSIYNNTSYTTDVTTPINSTDYADIEKVLQNYAKDYRKEGYSDTYYSGCGLGESKYIELKNAMLKSVYENGGFWIGQYEMGYELKEGETVRYFDDQREHLVDKSPVCKEGAYPYNFVTCKQAQGLASSMKSGNYTSSLMFGIQWDLVMKFIETKEGKTQDELKKDSKDWGNYQNVSFDVTKGKYSTDKGQTFTEVIGSYTKPARTDENEPGILLTTGASERNSVLNIYDIAGNVYEFTLEKYTVDLNYPCCVRGGKNSGYGNKYPAYIHDYGNASNSFNFTGFRSALY